MGLGNTIDPWLWLGGSALLAVAASQVLWNLERTAEPDSWPSRIPDWYRHSSAAQLLRLVYYLCLPFAALLWGRDAVIGRLLGLQSVSFVTLITSNPAAGAVANWTDWIRDLGWAGGLAALAWAVLGAGWLLMRRTFNRPRPTGQPSGWTSLREAVFHETHWAFYRNGPAVALGPYYGAWMGLGLVILEALLNPYWRAGLQDPQLAAGYLVRAGTAVLSAVLFLQTQNLGLAIAAHWAVTWGFAATVQADLLGPQAQGSSQPRETATATPWDTDFH